MSRDPRDIIIRPVVSEKSYAAYDENVYTFIVAPDANKIEIRKAVEELFGKKVDEGPHDQPQGQAQAQPPHGNVGQPRRPEAGHRHPRRRRGSHRHLRELTMPFASASRRARVAGSSRRPTSPRSRRTSPRSRLTKPKPKTGGRNALRPHDVASPRRRSQAALPPRRLQAEQGRRAREGRRDRVRPEPQRAHRAAALPRRREALHPRPERPRRSATCCRAARVRRSAPATRCRCATSRSARRCTTSS